MDTLDRQWRRCIRTLFWLKQRRGGSDVTIRNYRQHLHNISKYLDIEQSMVVLSKRDLESMVCEMRAVGLAHNSISTYVRMLRTSLNWCQREGWANLTIPNMKDKETVKETYTDEEFSLLLQKPKSDCFLGNICSAISMGKCSLRTLCGWLLPSIIAPVA